MSWLRLNVSLFYLHFKCFCYDFSVFFINNWSCRVKGRTWFSQRKSWHNWHNRPVVFGLLICCSCCCLAVILIINANAIHPFSSAYPVQGHGEWESILASIKQEAGYTECIPPDTGLMLYKNTLNELNKLNVNVLYQNLSPHHFISYFCVYVRIFFFSNK